MKRTENELDSKQILSVIERYNHALDLLDAYDHQTMKHPKGNEATYVLTYEECIEVIQSMRFGAEFDLFGREKDDSFKGSIGKCNETGWYRIEYNGGEAFVSDSYLVNEKPVQQEHAVQPSSSSGSGSGGGSVTVPSHEDTVGNLVWVPTKGRLLSIFFIVQLCLP